MRNTMGITKKEHTFPSFSTPGRKPVSLKRQARREEIAKEGAWKRTARVAGATRGGLNLSTEEWKNILQQSKLLLLFNLQVTTRDTKEMMADMNTASTAAQILKAAREHVDTCQRTVLKSINRAIIDGALE
ncbi:hypothetical protein CC80DRAFT_69967 [Byssothecium circinans]|uniref:Uncharacterized protein n=1 Tax=Byssothecium circinans TaxID=147558 RepID=A0A6A5TU06_9PLEO|nr:hypothetical protein CC80DRAFT_69967 [Byssothecium circinans]